MSEHRLTNLAPLSSEHKDVKMTDLDKVIDKSPEAKAWQQSLMLARITTREQRGSVSFFLSKMTLMLFSFFFWPHLTTCGTSLNRDQSHVP